MPLLGTSAQAAAFTPSWGRYVCRTMDRQPCFATPCASSLRLDRGDGDEDRRAQDHLVLLEGTADRLLLFDADDFLRATGDLRAQECGGGGMALGSASPAIPNASPRPGAATSIAERGPSWSLRVRYRTRLRCSRAPIELACCAAKIDVRNVAGSCSCSDGRRGWNGTSSASNVDLRRPLLSRIWAVSNSFAVPRPPTPGFVE
ncbi:uncharacterized protein PSFLO_01943 [Pseudozyma flocculosa]|uniref:Uncharacterized protein n=1 Tax=Pseudozyma flocculosa TaxID=84751 RepID=A0A5C3EWN0_9BASI|nr:uncharacterized protein PSFLO_01943 [Pseudozyma flocculosa]